VARIARVEEDRRASLFDQSPRLFRADPHRLSQVSQTLPASPGLQTRTQPGACAHPALDSTDCRAGTRAHALDRPTFVDERPEYNIRSEARRNGQVFHARGKKNLASGRLI
jgi:hypothetical protein